MVQNRVVTPQKIGEAMQGPLVRVARPEHQENRMVEGRGREAASFGEADAHTVADNSADYRQNRRAMPGTI